MSTLFSVKKSKKQAETDESGASASDSGSDYGKKKKAKKSPTKKRPVKQSPVSTPARETARRKSAPKSFKEASDSE